MTGGYSRRPTKHFREPPETDEWVLEDLPYLVPIMFVGGVIAPYVWPDKFGEIGPLLPGDPMLALFTLLLGSAFFYGLASLPLSFAVGMRMAPLFSELADVAESLFSIFGSSGMAVGDTPILSQDVFFTSLLGLAVGAFMCSAAAGFGTAIYRASHPSGALVNMGLFGGCAALLVYLGLW